MGGRGATAAGFIDPNNMHWEQLPYSVFNEDALILGKYKILRYKDSDKAKVPIESNKADAIYIISDRNGEIKYIAEYTGHKIFFTVDLDYRHGPHAHKWKDGQRASHDPNNTFRVPGRYKEILAACDDFNSRHFHKKLPQPDSKKPRAHIEKTIRKAKDRTAIQ